MKIIFTTLALLSIATADVSHLSREYLPPKLESSLPKQQVTHVKENRKILQASLTVIDDNSSSTFDDISSKKEAAQITSGHLGVKKVNLSGISEHLFNNGNAAQHVQNSAEVTHLNRKYLPPTIKNPVSHSATNHKIPQATLQAIDDIASSILDDISSKKEAAQKPSGHLGVKKVNLSGIAEHVFNNGNAAQHVKNSAEVTHLNRKYLPPTIKNPVSHFATNQKIPQATLTVIDDNSSSTFDDMSSKEEAAQIASGHLGVKKVNLSGIAEHVFNNGNAAQHVKNSAEVTHLNRKYLPPTIKNPVSHFATNQKIPQATLTVIDDNSSSTFDDISSKKEAAQITSGHLGVKKVNLSAVSHFNREYLPPVIKQPVSYGGINQVISQATLKAIDDIASLFVDGHVAQHVQNSAGVSHLNRQYLPPAPQQHVPHVGVKHIISPAALEAIVDISSVIDDISSQDEAAQIASGQLVVKKVDFSDIAELLSSKRGNVAEHVQKYAGVPHLTGKYLPPVIDTFVQKQQNIPTSPIVQTHAKKEPVYYHYDRVHEQQKQPEQQQHAYPNIDIRILEQKQKQQPQPQLQHKHNVPAYASVIRKFSQQKQQTGNYRKQSTLVGYSASAGIDTQYGANGGYTYGHIS